MVYSEHSSFKQIDMNDNSVKMKLEYIFKFFDLRVYRKYKINGTLPIEPYVNLKLISSKFYFNLFYSFLDSHPDFLVSTIKSLIITQNVLFKIIIICM